ncbi:MAG: M14 family zinc carboxypeptidase, partial [Burkholderiaceae bacterium]
MHRVNRLSSSAAALAAACAIALPATTLAAEAVDDTGQLLLQEQQADNFYRAYFPDAATGRRAAISFHEQILEANWKGGYLVLQLSDADVAKLRAFKFRVAKDQAFIERHQAMLKKLQELGAPNLFGASGAALAQRAAESGEAIPNYPCYETVEETFTAAQGFTTTYANLATWTPVGQSWQKTNGLGGYDMAVLKLTNKNTTGPNGEAKPKLFVNSAIHAREYVTAPLMLAFAKALLTGYGKDPEATWILDHHEIHLLLHTNPDGRKKAETGLYWRKNTNQNY